MNDDAPGGGVGYPAVTSAAPAAGTAPCAAAVTTPRSGDHIPPFTDRVLDNQSVNHWTSEPDDLLEVQASEWLVLRDARLPRTPAVRAVERALTDAYERRRNVRMLEPE